MARERKQRFLSKVQQTHHTFLVLRTESNDWNNNNGMYRKKNVTSLLSGSQPLRRDSHSDQMRRHIQYSPWTGHCSLRTSVTGNVSTP